MVRQLCIELAMCGAVDSHSLVFTVSIALIGIKESGERGMSVIVYAGFFRMLTEIPEPSTSRLQHRASMPMPICPRLDSISEAWE